MKNVSLIKGFARNRQIWRLLDKIGEPYVAFDSFAKTLERDSINTYDNYCRWLAEFFDYLIEACEMYQAKDGQRISREVLRAVIESYDAYLVLGPDSCNEIAIEVNSTLPSPRISAASSASKHAAVKRFIKMSDRIRAQMEQLPKSTIGQSVPVDHVSLFEEIGSKRVISVDQRKAMMSHSMIAGVISGGPKLFDESFLTVRVPRNDIYARNAFPFDQFKELAKQLRTYRDRALYAFCAASGCRISEALQLLWEDIDFENRTVKLVDPKTRQHHPSYAALGSMERNRLVWKGRTTNITLLVEPFRSLFFEYLSGYLRTEYIPHGKHKFAFQFLGGENAGRPYFLASASSRNDVFKRALKKANINSVAGPHSLRHMYGSYSLNFFPRKSGEFGLPMVVVQQMLGHASHQSTKKYAKLDNDVLMAELGYANNKLLEVGGKVSLYELKRQAILRQLNSLDFKDKHQVRRKKW